MQHTVPTHTHTAKTQQKVCRNIILFYFFWLGGGGEREEVVSFQFTVEGGVGNTGAGRGSAGRQGRGLNSSLAEVPTKKIA